MEILHGGKRGRALRLLMVSRLAQEHPLFLRSSGSNLIYIHGRLNIFEAKPPPPTNTCRHQVNTATSSNTANLFSFGTIHLSYQTPIIIPSIINFIRAYWSTAYPRVVMPRLRMRKRGIR